MELAVPQENRQIRLLRFQIRDVKEPYTFPDDVLQEELDEAAYRMGIRYSANTGMRYYNANDPALLPTITGLAVGYRGFTPIDLYSDSLFSININTPTGRKVQRLMAAIGLMSMLLTPSSDRTPTSVSEQGLSIQWGGDYNSAIEIWTRELEQILKEFTPPLMTIYNNY